VYSRTEKGGGAGEMTGVWRLPERDGERGKVRGAHSAENFKFGAPKSIVKI